MLSLCCNCELLCWMLAYFLTLCVWFFETWGLVWQLNCLRDCKLDDDTIGSDERHWLSLILLQCRLCCGGKGNEIVFTTTFKAYNVDHWAGVHSMLLSWLPHSLSSALCFHGFSYGIIPCPLVNRWKHSRTFRDIIVLWVTRNSKLNFQPLNSFSSQQSDISFLVVFCFRIVRTVDRLLFQLFRQEFQFWFLTILRGFTKIEMNFLVGSKWHTEPSLN